MFTHSVHHGAGKNRRRRLDVSAVKEVAKVARLALRTIVVSVVLSFCIAVAGCTPGGGGGAGGASQPAASTPASAPAASAPSSSASPVDDGY
jgi:hypothetical protein